MIRNQRLAWAALVAVALVAGAVISVGAAPPVSSSADDCGSDDCGIERTDETVMSSETEDGEIRVTGDVAPGETVTITLTDGLADADVTINGEPVAPSDTDGEIEVIVPEDGEVIIIVEAERADHEITLAGDETSTEVSSSVSSSGSATSTSTTTSTSTST